MWCGREHNTWPNHTQPKITSHHITFAINQSINQSCKVRVEQSRVDLQQGKWPSRHSKHKRRRQSLARSNRRPIRWLQRWLWSSKRDSRTAFVLRSPWCYVMLCESMYCTVLYSMMIDDPMLEALYFLRVLCNVMVMRAGPAGRWGSVWSVESGAARPSIIIMVVSFFVFFTCSSTTR